MSAPLPDAYFPTVFIVEDAPDPQPERFAVVTAWNPMDRPTPDGENEKADAELARKVSELDADSFRVHGCAPDGSHIEPGWGFRAELRQALDLGSEFGQRAIWWIERDRLHLVACEDGRLRDIGCFSDRIIQPDPPHPS